MQYFDAGLLSPSDFASAFQIFLRIFSRKLCVTIYTTKIANPSSLPRRFYDIGRLVERFRSSNHMLVIPGRHRTSAVADVRVV